MRNPEVFISYTRSPEETAWVSAFARALEEQGHSVWLDAHEVQWGDRWQQKLERALRGSETLVAVIDPKHIDQPAVNFELGAALGMRKRIIPILPADDLTPLPYNLRARRFLVRGSPEETATRVAEALAPARPEPSEAGAG
jgi:TIR domain